MPITVTQANKVLAAQIGKTAFGTQTAYVGLSSTTPANGDPATNITEPSGGGYARVATAGSDWNAPSAGSVSNSNAITFAAASGTWASGSNMTYGVLFDALTGGNVIGYGVLSVAKPVYSGDVAQIAAGQLTITLS